MSASFITTHSLTLHCIRSSLLYMCLCMCVSLVLNDSDFSYFVLLIFPCSYLQATLFFTGVQCSAMGSEYIVICKSRVVEWGVNT